MRTSSSYLLSLYSTVSHYHSSLCLPLFTEFTETFEGLGIGSRLALLKIDLKYNWIPIAAALLYGLTTPIGIAAGLGVRSTYNPGTATASIVSGSMDSISAGILIYTSLVEVCTFRLRSHIKLLLTPTDLFSIPCHSLWHTISCSTRRCWLLQMGDSPFLWVQ